MSDFTQGMLVGIAIAFGSMVILLVVLAVKQMNAKNREKQE